MDRRRLRFVLAALGVLLAILTVVRVTLVLPRVHIRWQEDLTSEVRTEREERYGLREGAAVSGTTWRYELSDDSPENIGALVRDPAVADTAYIDRDRMTSDGQRIIVTIWHPFRDLFDRPSQLLRLYPSFWLLLASAALWVTTRAPSAARRRLVTLATLLFVGIMGIAVPVDPSFVRMGGNSSHAMSRAEFEDWFGGNVRFEKHLSQMLQVGAYQLDSTEDAAERAVIIVSRGATAWFVLSAVAIAVLESWSAVVLRYLALVLLAPAAILYFGWREFGYMSLSVAAFPLLARGLRDGGARLEAASALIGFGAALHGSGLVSVAGAGLAALGARIAPYDRILRVLRVAAWTTAAYLGWIALYVIALKLSVIPDPGAAGVSPWRPWFADEVRAGRLASAIFSPIGARDLFMAAWVVGAPLLAVAASLRQRHPHEVRAALLYAVPSILFVIFRWPLDGMGSGTDLVLAGFPAVYALAWVCAQDERRFNVAALLLASAHYAFWRIALDERFLT